MYRKVYFIITGILLCSQVSYPQSFKNWGIKFSLTNPVSFTDPLSGYSFNAKFKQGINIGLFFEHKNKSSDDRLTILSEINYEKRRLERSYNPYVDDIIRISDQAKTDYIKTEYIILTPFNLKINFPDKNVNFYTGFGPQFYIITKKSCSEDLQKYSNYMKKGILGININAGFEIKKKIPLIIELRHRYELTESFNHDTSKFWMKMKSYSWDLTFGIIFNKFLIK